jgi:hypothetical protein
MASEIRVNQIQNRSGLSTVTFSDTGVVISGITTITDLRTTGGALIVGTGASIFSPATNQLALGTNNTEDLRIDASGNVGVGTVAPSSLFHLLQSSGNAKITIQRSNTATNTDDYGSILWRSSAANNNGAIGVARESGENDGYMYFSTGSGGTLSEKLRINSSGKLIIGHTGASGSGTLLETSSTSSSTANLALVKRDSGTANQDGQNLFLYNFGPSGTARASGTSIGTIRWYASQPTSGAAQEAAAIYVSADGTQTGIYVPSFMSFTTGGTSSTSGVERLRIDSSGRVTAPYQPSFFVYGNTDQNINSQAGVYVKTTIWTASHNVGSNWSSNRFTAPVAGKYLFGVNLRMDNISSTYSRVIVGKNGSTNLNQNGHAITRFEAYASSYHTNAVTILFDMAANDYVEVYAFANDDSAYQVQSESQWWGYLVG